MKYDTIRTNNMSPFYGGAGIERRTNGGGEYLVAPGVLSMSDVYSYPRANRRGGATHEYLPDDAIEGSVGEWEGVPLLLDHPRDANDNATTIPAANESPIVIGEVRSPTTTTDDGRTKLHGEAWIDRAHVGENDGAVENIVSALEDNGIIETSAAYQAEYKRESGVIDGERYDAVHASIKPDHVAVFDPATSTEGNCSVDAGCGIGRANSPHDTQGTRSTRNTGGTQHTPGTLGGRMLSALGLGELSGPRANEDGQTPDGSADTDMDADEDNDTQTMKDDYKIDYLVNEHDLDRENMAPLEGTECLDDIYDRYTAVANESPPSAPDEGDGSGGSGGFEQQVMDRLDTLEEQINEQTRAKRDKATEQVANQLGIDAGAIELDADAAGEILDNGGQAARANMAGRPGPVDHSAGDEEEYVAAVDDGSRFGGGN